MIKTMTSQYLGLDKQPIQIARAKNRNSFYPLHRHDGFCEVYILLKGSLEHLTNHSRTLIQEPSLIFIRESDIHRIQSHNNLPNIFYLVKIHKNAYKNLANYFGLSNTFLELENAKEAPIIPLSREDLIPLSVMIKDLPNLSETDSHHQFKYSTFLINLFDIILTSKLPLKQDNKVFPTWFKHLLEQANDKDTFVKGVPGLIKLSGKSNPYLCKCFNKYLGQTPSAFINNLRLLHAKTLLTDSDLSILDISLDCGYENLSHFYHLFNDKFNTTPNKFRQSKNDIYI